MVEITFFKCTHCRGIDYGDTKSTLFYVFLISDIKLSYIFRKF